MSNNFKKVLYLGAWAHIEVVNYFPNCDEFILIDTQPRSEHDEKNYFYEGFYRNKFIDRVIKKCKKYNFILTEKIELDPEYMSAELSANFSYINPHLFIFNNSTNNKKRIIKYYISTNILFNMNPTLENDSKTSDPVYVAGYAPDVILLKYLNKKINFVGDNNTVYFYERAPDENDIINTIIKLDEHLYPLSEWNYYLVWRQKSMIIVCDSLVDINNKKNQINNEYYYEDSD